MSPCCPAGSLLSELCCDNTECDGYDTGDTRQMETCLDIKYTQLTAQ